MTKHKIFILAIVGIFLINSFCCGKAQKKKTEEKQPQRQEVQTQEKPIEAKAKLIDYEITRRWASGVEVSIPHFSTKEQIKQLNDELVQKYFRSTPIISIQYNCLDHPDLTPYVKNPTGKYFHNKELIATYSRNRTTGFEELDISSPTPGNRYPDIMAIEEIRKLNAQAKEKNKGNQ